MRGSMQDHGLLPVIDRRFKILLIVGSHGFPATQARFARVRELAAELALRGATLHLLLLVEKPLTPRELDQVRSLRHYCHKIELVEHPEITSRIYRTWRRFKDVVAERFGRRRPAADLERHCPENLLRILHSRYVPRNYTAMVVSGVRLAPCFDRFSRWTMKLLDLPRFGHAVHASHRQNGREDVFQRFAKADTELRLAERADLVIVRCHQDAVHVRTEGFRGEIVYAPLPVGVEYGNFELQGEHRQTPPPRPPRILYVGSDTIANLDGLRWFRRQVFPQILQSVPTCRLRIIGEAARHIEPGPAIDQVGPVDHVAKEYNDAAVVILPLRMGSGVRRRAVEAIAARKALVTTSIGAYGLSLRPMQDAVVSDDPGELASETIRILSTDQLRIEYEENVAALARRDLDSRLAMASFCRALGLPVEPDRTRLPEPTTV